MARNVVFAAPFPAEVTHRFVQAARDLENVRLLGLVHVAPETRGLYHDVERVSDPLDNLALMAGVEALARRHGPIDRVIGVLEAIQVQLAEVRARFGIPGTKPDVARVFRDKAAMKKALQAAGLPVARARLVRSLADAEALVEGVGFPIVFKPPTGMGAKGTYRVRDRREMIEILRGLSVGPSRAVLAEEFLTGREHSLEAITTGAQVRLTSASRYFPSCLEAVENPWIQWCCLLPRALPEPEYAEAKAIGIKAIAALGLHQGVTHMEWFRREDGRVVIGEIALRPPGANISLMTGLAHDMSMYRAWARAEVDGAFDGPYPRNYAVGSAFLRGMGRGRVISVRGVKEVHERIGDHVVEAKLPGLGAPKSDSYEGDGYIVLRHTDTEWVKSALATIVDTIRVAYAG
ncbi:MAG: ATP-grasp domain-containing protein [Myxococcota bacterium]